MRQLPRACHAQYAQLDQRPAHDLRVGGFALVTEFSFSFLFAADWYVSNASVSLRGVLGPRDILGGQGRLMGYVLPVETLAPV